MNLNDIIKKNQTYQGCDIDEPNPVSKMFKRAGRKMTFWYVHSFGENQNSFNKDICSAIAELNEEIQNQKLVNEKLSAQSKFSDLQIEELHSIIENLKTKIAELSKENSELIQQNTSELHDFICHSDPSYRKLRNVPAPVAERPVTSQLTQEIKEMDNINVQEKLEELERQFVSEVNSELDNSKALKKLNPIVIVCVGLKSNLHTEAIRNEAFDIYKLLSEKSIFPIKLVSVEPEMKITEQDGDTIFIPFDNATIKQKISELNPSLCILCESTAHILRSCNCALLMFHSILRLTGQNPLTNISASAMEEMRHLNDFGLHTYFVASETAGDIMVKNGFRKPIVIRPIIDAENPLFSVNSHIHTKFTVGFASSPMLENQSESRGIILIEELAKKAADCEFIILWRNKDVPETLSSLPNCKVIFGKYPMQKFYSEIDCLLVPYTSIDMNHACSLSGIEAMENGIPVLCTEISGISETVAFSGMGEICECNSESLFKGLGKIRNGQYFTPKNYERLQKHIFSTRFVSLVEQEAKREIPKGIVTLYEWDRQLKMNDKYLVKGQENMKKYYQQQEIAEKYTVQRFVTYPHNCFDLMERKSLGIILDRHFKGNRQLQILDIACGDGRITQENILHGSCLSADSSPAMLSIVKERFGDKPVETMQADYFNDVIDDRFDAVTTFRYIRHFEYEKRCRLYKKIRSNLRPDGIFIFDVPNLLFEIPLKCATGWKHYNIYDVFFDIKSITDELEENGFRIKFMIPIGQGLFSNIPEKYRNQPMTWTVGAVPR